ncbi:MAG TPA: HAD family hydrolase [Candidatus Onthousia faecipullorum]|uniref:D,D-heptose 1,7-bisphosphate phosphatase n=1 Tax=Candidatus Onthousia faecipullorum TaxID=2840887 RepID=A0A9D1GCK8_9FIRM|nr:HAD family hydrolase [Candidatus Onthousia faecipullorum]
MKKNKAVFLDRDGTINYDFGYVYEKDKLKFLPGVISSLKRLSEAGYLLIIITNQSGIGRRYFTLDEYNEFNNYMLKQLKDKGVNITKVYYCPHTDLDGCNCRKPKLGLFYQAIDEYNIDLDKSFAIGDNERDLAICMNSPICGILLNKDSKKFVSKKDFKDATDFILS